MIGFPEIAVAPPTTAIERERFEAHMQMAGSAWFTGVINEHEANGALRGGFAQLERAAARSGDRHALDGIAIDALVPRRDLQGRRISPAETTHRRVLTTRAVDTAAARVVEASMALRHAFLERTVNPSAPHPELQHALADAARVLAALDTDRQAIAFADRHAVNKLTDAFRTLYGATAILGDTLPQRLFVGANGQPTALGGDLFSIMASSEAWTGLPQKSWAAPWVEIAAMVRL